MDSMYRPGLEGVQAAETTLSRVDGEAGELWIGGFAVEEMAPQASFEETVYLLWHGRLPTQGELDAFCSTLAAQRALPPETLQLLAAAARRRCDTMDALRMATASLAVDGGGALREAEALVAAFPTVVAAYWRLLQEQSPIEPDAGLGHAANYLYMLFGETPSSGAARALETYLNTVVDHGMNASTFTARVIISTRSDVISAVTGAVGALKGPLHGGAPGPALDTVLDIGTSERAEEVLRRKVAAGERLMGFGHRVYRVRDPRAEVLSAAAEELYRGGDQEALYALAKHVERVAIRVLSEHKPDRRLETNVEFYTALLLHGIGLDSRLFTPTFAISRVGGWTAHAFEQLERGRLIRPRAAYVGATPGPWVPRGERQAAPVS